MKHRTHLHGMPPAVNLLAVFSLICAGLLPGSVGAAYAQGPAPRIIASVSNDDLVAENQVSPLFSPDWTAESNLGAAIFGAAVASAGDVNGDGYDDVIVGAPYASNGQVEEGRAYVYHGSASGPVPVPAWVFETNTVQGQVGWSVASAGDVNKDGYDDVIVGAPYFSNDLTYEGRAYVFYGSAAGLATAPAWMKEGDQAQARFGMGVASAGDVNKDGYDDVIVGAPWYANPESNEGMAYVYHGSASGLSTTANWTAESNMNWTGLGWSVASAGDVNGDGYGDVIIGVEHLDNPEEAEGGAYVYHGSASGLSALPAWTYESNQVEAHFGDSVASAADVNGDGYDDVIVGAFWYDSGQVNEGRVYVFHGSAAGLSFTPAWTAESDKAGAEFGHSAASARDVNGDGYSDVIVGAPWFSNDQDYEGRAYLYYGSNTGLLPAPAGTAESNQVRANMGYSVASAGDVNGDGLDDLIVGAQNFDHGQENEGQVFIYRGGVKYPLFLPRIEK